MKDPGQDYGIARLEPLPRIPDTGFSMTKSMLSLTPRTNASRVLLWLVALPAWFILVAPGTVHAADFLNVRYLSCYDGDTCTVTIPYVHPLFGKKIPVRLAGVDTPEKGGRGKCDQEKALAIKAHQLTQSMMEHASQIDLRNVARGDFFRLWADVMVDGVSLGERLLECGLALPYNGKQKPDWCR